MPDTTRKTAPRNATRDLDALRTSSTREATMTTSASPTRQSQAHCMVMSTNSSLDGLLVSRTGLLKDKTMPKTEFKSIFLHFKRVLKNWRYNVKIPMSLYHISSTELLNNWTNAINSPRFSALCHFHTILEGGFGQSFFLRHVITVFLSRVEIPSANRTFLVALE